MLQYLIFGGLGIVGILFLMTIWVLTLRRIVPTNEVHIVQRDKVTVSYGKDAKDGMGNVYYQFPSWIPKLGVVVSKLPTTVFDVDLKDYEAYDKEKLQFKVDIKAFFRISDFNTAASRVFSVQELKTQLEGIVQGAVRNVLASDYLESIMIERTKYGDMFSHQVASQLQEWGVVAVKNIELMDIKDSQGEEVIANIMMKKKSAIEMERRTEVAKNTKKSQEAELDAQQQIQLKQQDVVREVGLRKAEVEKEVGIANQKQEQEVQAEAKLTAEKQMEVKRVKEIQVAEIEKQAAEVKANQDKEVTKVNAEAQVIQAEANKKVQVTNATAAKEQTVLQATAEKERVELQAQATKTSIELKADADLKAATNEAKGIKLKGESTADARERLEKAQVAGQIELKDKVTGDEHYQDFMIRQAQVEAMQAIGVAQAQNLSGAEVKIYATAGNVAEGATKVGSVFTPKTGVDLASSLEAFANTEIGKSLTEKFLKSKKEEK